MNSSVPKAWQFEGGISAKPSGATSLAGSTPSGTTKTPSATAANNRVRQDLITDLSPVDHPRITE
jgi:hypothetical protein